MLSAVSLFIRHQPQQVATHAIFVRFLCQMCGLPDATSQMSEMSKCLTTALLIIQNSFPALYLTVSCKPQPYSQKLHISGQNLGLFYASFYDCLTLLSCEMWCKTLCMLYKTPPACNKI